jgi:hypothetical protein
MLGNGHPLLSDLVDLRYFLNFLVPSAHELKLLNFLIIVQHIGQFEINEQIGTIWFVPCRKFCSPDLQQVIKRFQSLPHFLFCTDNLVGLERLFLPQIPVDLDFDDLEQCGSEIVLVP